MFCTTGYNRRCFIILIDCVIGLQIACVNSCASSPVSLFPDLFGLIAVSSPSSNPNLRRVTTRAREQSKQSQAEHLGFGSAFVAQYLFYSTEQSNMAATFSRAVYPRFQGCHSLRVLDNAIPILKLFIEINIFGLDCRLLSQ